MIDITGLPKEKVLMALFNGSKQQGLGTLNKDGKEDITEEQAEQIIKEHGLFFDYLNGRFLKVNLTSDSFDEWCYDRDNGAGAALKAIQNVMKK